MDEVMEVTEANHDNVTSLPRENPYILPWWRQAIWNTMFIPMIVGAIGGNLIVIYIVLAHKRMRTVTNYFLLNLSIADALAAILNVTFTYIFLLNNDWPFGTVYCKISQAIAVLTICASVFSLIAISIDRYMAIMNPLKPRMSKRATLCVAISIWIAGAVMAVPMLFFSTTFDVDYLNGDVRTLCIAAFPDMNEDGVSNHEYVYNVIFMILTYFLPIGSMTFAYVKIGRELWGSQSIGENTAGQLEGIRTKRRVVKMMIMVVVLFAVCWLPFQVYFVAELHWPEITEKPYIQEFFLGIYWLAMSNSMFNPIIYCWLNTRFREGFMHSLSWCPWIRVHLKLGNPQTNTRISRNGMSYRTSSGRPCTTSSSTSMNESRLDHDDAQTDERNSYINLNEISNDLAVSGIDVDVKPQIMVTISEQPN